MGPRMAAVRQMAVRKRVMRGPVGRAGRVAEMRMAAMEARMAMTMESAMMEPSVRTKNFAVMTGVMRNAVTRMTPTACMAATMTRVRRRKKRASMSFTGRPMRRA